DAGVVGNRAVPGVIGDDRGRAPVARDHRVCRGQTFFVIDLRLDADHDAFGIECEAVSVRIERGTGVGVAAACVEDGSGARDRADAGGRARVFGDRAG